MGESEPSVERGRSAPLLASWDDQRGPVLIVCPPQRPVGEGIELVSRVARTADRRVVVLRPVVLPRQTSIEADGEFTEPHRNAVRAIVEAFEDRGVKVEGVVCRGHDLAHPVARTAEEHGIGLALIPGRPPVGELGGFGRDEVDRVVAETDAPVIVYGEPPAPTEPSRIMVAVAGGPHTDRMLSWARLLARAWRAEMELFHVVDPEADEPVLERARTMLAEAVNETLAPGVELRLLEGEDVTQAVLDASTPRDALVLGAPTRSRWRHLFYGSRARKVQRTSPGWSFVVHRAED